MERTALDAVRRVQSTAERAKNAAKRNPITSGTLATMGAVGGLWFASQLLGSQSRTGPGSEMLYTEESCNEKTLKQILEDLKDLDAKDDTATSQTHFENLMANWTTAAGLYSQAGNCDKAHYALGRLCYEGRGYVYDPEYGIQLYERAAYAGNADAMYALACIALRLADNRRQRDSGYDVLRSNKSANLYEAAALLRLAQTKGHEGARRTLSDFSDRPDPMTWIKNTRTKIETAAKTDPSATSQILRIAAQARDEEGGVMVEVEQELRDYKIDTHPPKPGTGGWREDVRRLNRLLDNSEEPETDTIRELLAQATRGTDPREMTSAALVALKYLDHVDLEDVDSDTLGKNADALLEKAARTGDVGAIKHRADALKGMFRHQERRAETETAIMKVLDQGARTGPLLSERGMLNHDQFLRMLKDTKDTDPQQKQGKKAKAMSDLLRAASLGNQEAMRLYRYGSFSDGWSDGNGAGWLLTLSLYSYNGVVVLPIPAALAMDLFSPCKVVFSRGDNATPIVTKLKVGIEPPGDKVIVATGYQYIQVAWPDLKSADAYDRLLQAYKDIFAQTNHDWMVLEPIRRDLFGSNEEAYELTARAILKARSAIRFDKKKPQVAFCVFDDPTHVCSYDRAFMIAAGLIPKTSDGVASDGETSYGEDGEASDGEIGRPRHRVEQKRTRAEQGSLFERGRRR